MNSPEEHEAIPTSQGVVASLALILTISFFAILGWMFIAP
jgi:hypothetical protein